MAETRELVQIDGGCHCGNLRFAFFRPPWGEALPARACGCSFCVKHGGAYTSHPQGRIEVRVDDPALVEKYRFGTRTADFFICRRCGVVPLVTSEIDGTRYAVVSVRALEGIDPAAIDLALVDFEGEGTGDRLERRRSSWIGQVTGNLGD